MKKLRLALATTLSFLALLTVSRAAVVSGTVFCDGNQNGIIDTGDVGIPGVLVVITNENNSFSNSDVTGPDGSFSVQIPNPSASAAARDPLSQIFVETLLPASLPDGSSIVIPTAITNLTSTPAYFISFASVTNKTNLVFTSGTGTSSTGDWLINNPECGSAGSAGNCKLSGKAQIVMGHREADHSFNGTILSGNPPSGKWTDISHSLGLQFKSTAIQSVTCGTDSIEFTGTGVLQSLRRGGHRADVENGTPVQFTVEVENLSVGNGRKNRTVQAYYLRVFTADDTTLELVSTDTLDPTDIAPEPITQSDLRIHSE
jgi:hypothetical protein